MPIRFSIGSADIAQGFTNYSIPDTAVNPFYTDVTSGEIPRQSKSLLGNLPKVGLSPTLFS